MKHIQVKNLNGITKEFNIDIKDEWSMKPFLELLTSLIGKTVGGVKFSHGPKKDREGETIIINII